jgi:glycosyltransferase involved in cell wall biosynthesis
MDEVKKNVLYISYDGMTDPLGQSQVLPYIFGLTKKGYAFHLISFEKAEKFPLLKEHIQNLCTENQVNWHPFIYTKKPPLLSTLYDVWRMKKLAISLHKEHSFVLTHCRSYLSALVGLEMKRKQGVNFLFDMRGFWADERVDGKIWSLSNPIFRTVYNYFKQKEKQFFLESDHIISLTYNGKNEICSWPNFDKLTEKIEVIPCCADLTMFDPNEIQENRKVELLNQLKIPQNRFILGYVGSIGTWYMLEEMLQAFSALLSKKADAIFLIISGDNAEQILERADAIKIPRDSLRIQSATHKDVSAYISLFNASVFFIRPTYSKKASSPTKQGELMSMGIPIICNAGVGDTDMVIKKYEAGIVLEELTPAVFSEINWDQISFNKTLAQFGAQEFYGLETGVQRYLKVYEKIIQ